jgi:hypothetical protein
MIITESNAFGKGHHSIRVAAFRNLRALCGFGAMSYTRVLRASGGCFDRKSENEPPSSRLLLWMGGVFLGERLRFPCLISTATKTS